MTTPIAQDAPAGHVGDWHALAEDATDERGSSHMPRVFWARIDLWGPLFHLVDQMTSHPDVWDLLATLIQSNRPRVIVEAGTYRGIATMAMAEALALVDDTEAMVYTADVVDFHVKDLVIASGHHGRVMPWLGRFEDMLTTIPGPIDFAFIDASELETPRLRVDYAELVYDRLSPGGLIVVDDCADDAWPYARHMRQWASLYVPAGRGTVIIQKPR